MGHSLLPRLLRSSSGLHVLLESPISGEGMQVRLYQATQNNWERTTLNAKRYRATVPLKRSPWLESRARILRRHYDKQENKKYCWVGLCTFFVLSGAFVCYGLGKPLVDYHWRDRSFRLPITLQLCAKLASKMDTLRKTLFGPSPVRLLPDILVNKTAQPKYTLVIELMEILVHPEWTPETGWKYRKRPWAEDFLQELNDANFEVVVTTKEHGMIALPIIDALDPNSYITHRIVGESIDLKNLNRDLSKVIVLDWNMKSTEDLENTLVLRRWEGNDDDLLLQDLSIFLKEISLSNKGDVRPLLSYYKQFSDPVNAFKEEYTQFNQSRMKNVAFKTNNERRLYLQKWTPLTNKQECIKKLI